MTRTVDGPPAPGYDKSFNSKTYRCSIYHETLGKYRADVFAIKLNPEGTELIYSTFLGGSMSDTANSIALDSSGNVYIAGSTQSGDFPMTVTVDGFSAPGYHQSHNDEVYGPDDRHRNSDAFIVKLNSTGTELLYSTFLGGTGHDYGNAIAVDSSGCIFVAGMTACSDFPMTKTFAGEPAPGYDQIFKGSFHAFVVKIAIDGVLPDPPDDPPPPGDEVDPKAPRNLTATSSDHCIYLKWDIPRSTPEGTTYNIYRKSTHDNSSTPPSKIGSIKRSDIAKLSHSIRYYAYYIDYGVDYDVTYEYYITQEINEEETGYSNKASAMRMYPTLLVHGFQAAFPKGYNPIFYSNDLITRFTGQNLHLTQTGNMISGYKWDFDRKKEFDDKRQEFIEMEHLITRKLKNLYGVTLFYDEHYLIKINRLDLKDTLYSPKLQNVYVSDYSYRTYIGKSRENRGLKTKHDYDSEAIYTLRAQTRDYIQVLARNLKREIDAIKRDTKASKVNIIAHSMGGLVARTYIEEKAFDSDYANDVRNIEIKNDKALQEKIRSQGERHGLPKYENDVHRLIMCGTPNHGTPTSSDRANVLSDWKSNKCGPQMAIDSYHLQILNYEQHFEFKNNCESTYYGRILIKKEDKLVNGVHYHMLAGIMPEVFSYNLWQKTWRQNENKKREIIEGIVSKQIEEAEKVLRVGENYVFMGDLSDKNPFITFQPKILVNYGRLYQNSKLQNQRYYMNHIMYHADHSQVYRNRTSFDLMSKILQGIIESTDPNDYNFRLHNMLRPTSYWKFYGHYNLDELRSQEELIKRVYSADLTTNIKDYLKLPFSVDENMAIPDSSDENQETPENLVILTANIGIEFASVGPFEHVVNTTETAFVDHINGNIQWFNPSSYQTSYRIEGLIDNQYNLRLVSLDFEADKEAFKIFEQYQMPTRENQADHIHINWDTQEVLFETDLDGDGEIDRRIIPPGAPSGLSANAHYRHVHLNWQRAQLGSNGIRGYRVYRSSSSSEEFVPIAFINTQRPMNYDQYITHSSNGGSGYSYIDISGASGESYTYYVVAEDDQQFNSLSSNMVQVGPLTDEPFPHLRISAEANKPEFFKGEEAMLFVTVANQGQETATHTTVTVTIPEETSFARATRFRSRELTSTMIEVEMGAIAGGSVQSFQVDLNVNEAVAQPRSRPVHFDVTCAEDSSDFTHVMLQLVPQRTGRPDLYLGLYYRNVQWDPQTSSIFIPQDTPLEIEMALTGAQLPYALTIDWGDGEHTALSDQRDLRRLLRHTFRSKGHMKIHLQVTDALQRTKNGNLQIEVR